MYKDIHLINIIKVDKMNNIMDPTSISMTMSKSHHQNYGLSSFAGGGGMNMNSGMMDQFGRIDIISKFTKCTHETMCQMLEFFYNTSLTAEQKKMVYNVPNCSITPAELSKIMFENFDDLEGSLDFMITKN